MKKIYEIITLSLTAVVFFQKPLERVPGILVERNEKS
jgi:hypothetical protein